MATCMTTKKSYLQLLDELYDYNIMTTETILPAPYWITTYRGS